MLRKYFGADTVVLVSLLIFTVMVLIIPSCASNAPPMLSPQATVAWQATQVIKTLDLIRDTAIIANGMTPTPLLSTQATRTIVQWHESAITVAHATPLGWKATIATSLDGVLRTLSPQEQHVLAPYVTLATTLLKETP